MTIQGTKILEFAHGIIQQGKIMESQITKIVKSAAI
jgi:hypothetical protein